MPRNACVILVPVGSFIEPACEEGLRELEKRGYEVRRVRGYAAIDQGRNQMATDALADGFDETLWIDADIGFSPDAVETLRRHELPITCAIYPQKGRRQLACHVRPGTKSVTFGQGGGLLEILYAATGFLHVRRAAYETIKQALKLPVCNEAFGRPTVPWFLPLVIEHGAGHWYLAEDFAFSERARQAGMRLFADTTIRLHHFGSYGYTWEESGVTPARYSTFTLNLE